MVQVSHPDQQAAFANRTIDAAVQAEPYATITKRQGLTGKWKLAGELVGDAPLLLLQFSPEMYTRKRAEGARLMIAYTRAARDYYDAFISGPGDRASAVDILIRRTPVKDPALYDEMGFYTVDPNPHVDVPGISAQQQWFFARGQMPELRAPVDLAAFTDRQFVDYALSVLGPYR